MKQSQKETKLHNVVSVRISPEEYKALKKESIQRGLTVSALVRTLAFEALLDAPTVKSSNAEIYKNNQGTLQFQSTATTKSPNADAFFISHNATNNEWRPYSSIALKSAAH